MVFPTPAAVAVEPCADKVNFRYFCLNRKYVWLDIIKEGCEDDIWQEVGIRTDDQNR